MIMTPMAEVSMTLTIPGSENRTDEFHILYYPNSHSCVSTSGVWFPGRYNTLDTLTWACHLHTRGLVDLSSLWEAKQEFPGFHEVTQQDLIGEVLRYAHCTKGIPVKPHPELQGDPSDFDSLWTAKWAWTLNSASAVDLTAARTLARGTPLNADHLRAALLS